jgi:hypothetical protein
MKRSIAAVFVLLALAGTGQAFSLRIPAQYARFFEPVLTFLDRANLTTLLQRNGFDPHASRLPARPAARRVQSRSVVLKPAAALSSQPTADGSRPSVVNRPLPAPGLQGNGSPVARIDPRPKGRSAETPAGSGPGLNAPTRK